MEREVWSGTVNHFVMQSERIFQAAFMSPSAEKIAAARCVRQIQDYPIHARLIQDRPIQARLIQDYSIHARLIQDYPIVTNV